MSKQNKNGGIPEDALPNKPKDAPIDEEKPVEDKPFVVRKIEDNTAVEVSLILVEPLGENGTESLLFIEGVVGNELISAAKALSGGKFTQSVVDPNVILYHASGGVVGPDTVDVATLIELRGKNSGHAPVPPKPEPPPKPAKKSAKKK